MTDSLVVTNSSKHITHCNVAFEELVQESEKSIIGQPLAEFLVLPELSGDLQSLAGTQKEILITNRSDNTQIPIFVSITRITEGTGTEEGLVCNIHNLSKRKALERQLVQSQKLESIGQLAAGVAHEINTPIQYVRDNMLFLQEELSPLLSALKHLTDSTNSHLEKLKETELKRNRL